MQVELPPVFWGVCVVTVLSPGPAVLMTLGNALTDRRAEVGLGIAGLFCGALLVALVTAAGVGALLYDQPRLAIALHWLGASYLGWLGLRLWRAASRVCAVPTGAGRRRHFSDAMLLQCVNPYTLAFFSSVLPQFVDPGADMPPQFAELIAVYLLILLTGHSSYALLAQPARHWLSSDGGARTLKRASALLFWALAVSMLVLQR